MRIGAGKGYSEDIRDERLVSWGVMNKHLTMRKKIRKMSTTLLFEVPI